MSQLFPKSANWIARASLALAAILAAGLFLLGWAAVNAPAVTGVGQAPIQPIAYSHAQHVGGLGLDCRYCHTSVETSNVAAIPPTETCMGCHNQVAVDSSLLEPVRTSFSENEPLAWIRVHDLADYVYFNHAIHVRQGVGCETCHGRVDQMPVVAKSETLQMRWCLECHREPERFLRPREAVFTMGYMPRGDQSVMGPQLVKSYGIHPATLSDCTVCHR